VKENDMEKFTRTAFEIKSQLQGFRTINFFPSLVCINHGQKLNYNQ